MFTRTWSQKLGICYYATAVDLNGNDWTKTLVELP